MPSSYTGADIAPYNTFGITCNATKPVEVTPALELAWYHNGTQLDNSFAGVLISEIERNAEVSSELSIVGASAVASGSYVCSVIIAVPESNMVQETQESVVTIRGKLYDTFVPFLCYCYCHLQHHSSYFSGPVLPAIPLILDLVSTNSTSATITWLVPSISYTQETYFIAYGVEITNLNSVSDTLEGTMNITAINLVYSITVDGLHPFTQYYYKLVAENLFPSGSSETAVSSFQTPEAGTLSILTSDLNR